MHTPNVPAANAIRQILDQYFDFELDSWDEDALPQREDLWRLHRDLANEYRRQAAQMMWLEVGCEKNPKPRLLIRFHAADQPAEEDGLITCYMDRPDAELLISHWNNEPVYGSRVTMHVTEILDHDIPANVSDEGHAYSYKEFLVDHCLIEG